jgi:hypothetical protein
MRIIYKRVTRIFIRMAIFEPIRYKQKQKLTLGLNKDVIERAKAAGINISEVTEQVLRALTYDPKGNTIYDVIEGYEKLFRCIAPILRRYDRSILVGMHKIYQSIDDNNKTIELPIELVYDTTLLEYGPPPNTGDYKVVEVDEVVYALDEPTKILENLILSVIQAAEENKEKIKELQFALRFVKTLFEEEK